MDQKDTKLARPLYRFICFSKSNGNAMRLIWMLMNALSRLLNPLNCKSSQANTTQSLLAAYLQRPHQSHQFAFRAIWGSRKLHPAIACWMGKKFAPAGQL